MNDHEGELEQELRRRLEELEALTLEVRHLQADLQVKDEYIAFLQAQSPASPADVATARRYLAVRSRVRTELQRHPMVWRLARAAVLRTRRWRE